jgi:hypothetical protein
VRLRAALVLVLATSGCAFHARAAGGGGDAAVDAAADPAADAEADAAPPAPTAMNGQHWLIPCLVDKGNQNCTCSTMPGMETVTIPGTQHWNVTVRIRGVMEGFTYQQGMPTVGSGWYVGGNGTNDGGDNIYELTISSPPQHYFLNQGPTGHNYSVAYDYMANVMVDGGATVTFYSSGQDGLQWANYDQNSQHIQFAGVTTVPDPYNGQFAQLDVINATAQ